MPFSIKANCLGKHMIATITEVFFSNPSDFGDNMANTLNAVSSIYRV